MKTDAEIMMVVAGRGRTAEKQLITGIKQQSYDPRFMLHNRLNQTKPSRESTTGTYFNFKTWSSATDESSSSL